MNSFVQEACWIAFEIHQASCIAHYSFVQHVVQDICLKWLVLHILTQALQHNLSIIHFLNTRIKLLSLSYFWPYQYWWSFDIFLQMLFELNHQLLPLYNLSQNKILLGIFLTHFYHYFIIWLVYFLSFFLFFSSFFFLFFLIPSIIFPFP